MYVFTSMVLAFSMSVCVFLRKQSHFTKHLLLFTQHVRRILRDFQSVQFAGHMPIYNREKKMKPYLPVGQLLDEF